MPAVIRSARATDIDALLAIENGAFEGDRLSRRSFRRLLGSRSAALLVAEEDGRAAGYCLVLFREGNPVARLYSIATAPGAARSGTGRLLLAAAEEAAAGRGRTEMRLEVREDNARAIGLYERNGFRRIGVKPGYYEDGAAALRYGKALASGDRTATMATVGRRAAG